MSARKGSIPWNKGTHKTVSTSFKPRQNAGSKNVNWKGGVTKRPGYQKEYLRRQRNAVVEALGGKCAVCGFSDHRALQIDHVHGGGSQERKIKGFSRTFHRHVLQSFLKGEGRYQLLCANCNWIKRFEKKEASGRLSTSVVKTSLGV